jgi:hypothetical protein
LVRLIAESQDYIRGGTQQNEYTLADTVEV